MHISNDGQRITSTDYWDTEHASAGLCYLSGNAGAWRLLVPEAAEGLLSEMRTGLRATIESSARDARCWDVVFDDCTDSPFSVAIDAQQIDRAVEARANSRLLVYTERALVLELPLDVKV